MVLSLKISLIWLIVEQTKTKHSIDFQISCSLRQHFICSWKKKPGAPNVHTREHMVVFQSWLQIDNKFE